MRRLVWIGAALLIMVGIMGYAMYTMRNIEKVNQQRREKDAGGEVVVQIVATTATTSVWDRLRETETETAETADMEVTENPNSMHQAVDPFATEAPEEETSDTLTDMIDATVPDVETTEAETQGMTLIVKP